MSEPNLKVVNRTSPMSLHYYCSTCKNCWINGGECGGEEQDSMEGCLSYYRNISDACPDFDETNNSAMCPKENPDIAPNPYDSVGPANPSEEEKDISRKPIVICISGKAGSGKDTAACHLKEMLEHSKSGTVVKIVHYGDLVKYIAKEFFGWDGCKNSNGRTILQYVGTDLFRARYPEYWVDFIIQMIDIIGKGPDRIIGDGNIIKTPNWDYVIIPDVRFPNEVNRIRERYVTYHMHITRKGNPLNLTDNQQNHPSESLMDNYPADIQIENNGTLEDFKWKSTYEIMKLMLDNGDM